MYSIKEKRMFFTNITTKLSVMDEQAEAQILLLIFFQQIKELQPNLDASHLLVRTHNHYNKPTLFLQALMKPNEPIYIVFRAV